MADAVVHEAHRLDGDRGDGLVLEDLEAGLHDLDMVDTNNWKVCKEE